MNYLQFFLVDFTFLYTSFFYSGGSEGAYYNGDLACFPFLA